MPPAVLYLTFYQLCLKVELLSSISKTIKPTCWQANKTGPVAKPSFRSADVGLPIWREQEVKSNTSSMSWWKKKWVTPIVLPAVRSTLRAMLAVPTLHHSHKQADWPEKLFQHFSHTDRQSHAPLDRGSPGQRPENKKQILVSCSIQTQGSQPWKKATYTSPNKPMLQSRCWHLKESKYMKKWCFLFIQFWE